MLFAMPVRSPRSQNFDWAKKLRPSLPVKTQSQRWHPLVDMRKWESKKLGVVIEVDYHKCTGIGQCVAVCPSGVYEIVNGKTTCPNIDECIQCCACQEACPVTAIKHHSCQ